MNARKTRWLICAVGCACIALLVAAALLAPETHNAGLEAVSFSRDSGFYDAPFSLELSGGGRIYYTLDASDPDENAIEYTGPIPIGDASENENVYSMNTDVALDFVSDVIQGLGYSFEGTYRVPESKIDKATVVRAVSIGADGSRSATENRVFFVGFDEKTGYDGLNIVTVTTDPKNLFDPQTGIYVLGKAFTDWLEQGNYKLDPDWIYTFSPANYFYKGRDWEREASVCFFDADRQLIASGNCGIRLQGHGSKAKLPKSLNLFARKEYGTAAFSGKDLLGVDYTLDRLNLNTGSQDSDSLLMDSLVNAFCADMRFGTREYVPYALFLDGEYWGVYWLTPRYKKDYMAQKYQIFEDNLVLYFGYKVHRTRNAKQTDNLMDITAGRIKIGNEEDMALYTDMRDFIAGSDMRIPDNYARACELIDIDSCLDYYATEIYIANNDWPIYNTALFRARKKAAGPYSDGKWRWLLFDVNMAMNVPDAQSDYVARTVKQDPLFASLMNNEAFSDALYRRLVRLATETFDPEKVGAFIDRHEALLDEQMDLKNQRFYNDEKSPDYFIKNCEKVRQFYALRREYILSQYGEQYG